MLRLYSDEKVGCNLNVTYIRKYLNPTHSQQIFPAIFMQILQEYIAALQQQYATLRASEDSYRPELMNFLKSLWGKLFLVQNDPRQTLFGKPDLHIWKDGGVIGYIETKTLDADLDSNDHKEQFDRYRNGFANLIITNFLEFRRYSRGKLVESAQVGTLKKRVNIATITLDDNGVAQVLAMLQTFTTSFDHTISDSAQLVRSMAALTQLIRENIRLALADSESGVILREQFEGFRAALLPHLEEEEFADVYAQTICYGLFAARCNAPQNERFTYREALYDLPKTNPFLRGLFEHLAGINTDFSVLWAAEDLAVILSRTDMSEILKKFGKNSPFGDPIIHFYETFLAAYNPALRKARGVYYTPPPVIAYIVRSVDELLKSRFHLRKGLTDTTKITVTNPQTKEAEQLHKVLILDPAVGTGAFLHEVIRQMHETFDANQGQWSGFVAKHLLPRIFGFELLVAPYAVAHLHVDTLLAETGYDFAANERLQVYLTNTLDKPETAHQRLPFARWLSLETEAAHRVKQDFPVMVILGNPPYAGNSANASTEKSFVGKGEFYTSKYKLAPNGRLEAVQRRASRSMDVAQRTYIGELIERYKFVDGKPLGEKNPKWLQDDYVKFIRLAQHRIEQTGFGVLAFITNNGYLDNPTFRGMRESLLQTFDEIYLYDLHGSGKKKEIAPDGSPDENVFDIQQGVSIGIFVKHETTNTTQIHAPCRVFHADLFGKREGKYKVLAASSVGKMEQNKEWSELQPTAPFYLFVPQNTDLRAEYEQAWKITDMMPMNVLGFQTHRDDFAIAFEEQTIRKRIGDMRNKHLSDEQIKQMHTLAETGTWKLPRVRTLLQNDEYWEKDITRCLYRPFDERFCYYNTAIVDRPRRELLDHIVNKQNLIIGVGRQGIAVNEDEWALVFCSRLTVDANIFRRGGINLFPLYRYPSEEEGMFAAAERTANFAPKFVEALEATLGKKLGADFTPEDVLYWCYAVLHSSDYRVRYAEFLKIDFPRVPFTSSWEVWQSLTVLGKLLVETHLMERSDLIETVTYPERGTNTVLEPKWEDERVYINATQYFGGVREEVWEMMIGGYQPAEKWLKDRRGRELSYDDIEHYRRVIASLTETMRLMDVIDEYVLDIGGVAALLSAEGA
jgi:hypothetical protein